MKNVLMVGPFPRDDTYRGISSVISTYLNDGEFGEYSVRYVPTSSHGSVVLKLLAFARGLTQYVFLILWWRPDIVHIHSASFRSFYRKMVYLAAAVALHRAVIIQIHGGRFREFFESTPAMIRRSITGLLNAASAVIVLSPAWQSYVRTITRNRNVVVLANPVNGREFLPCDHREDNHEPRVLYMGSLEVRKGLDELFAAVPGVLRNCPSARFIICGSGELTWCRSVCERRGIAPHVEFTGYVVGDEKLNRYREADLFVLPSHAEGFPVSIVEAMFAGLPIVATPVGGIGDVIKDDENGYLVPVGDVDALAGRILHLLMSPAVRRRMAENNRRKARELFDVGIVCANLRRIYDETIGRAA